MAWVFDLLGCYARGDSPEELPTAAPRAIEDFHRWRARSTGPMAIGTIKVAVAEVYPNFEASDEYWVNAFFEDDLRPVSAAEVEEAIELLSRSRVDLLDVLRGIRPALLGRSIAGESFGTIGGVVQHVAGAEWWYLDRMGLSIPRKDLPEEPLAMLLAVRGSSLGQLGQLVDNPHVREVQHERWSSRKVIRRMIWHERVHTRHIERLAATTR